MLTGSFEMINLTTMAPTPPPPPPQDGLWINSFRGLRRIPSYEVIDKCLLQITTPERGFLHEEVVNKRHEISIKRAMEMILVLYTQVGHMLEHIIDLYDPPHYYIDLDNVHMGDGHGQWRYRAPHHPIRRRLREGIARIPNYEDGLMVQHDEVVHGMPKALKNGPFQLTLPLPPTSPRVSDNRRHPFSPSSTAATASPSMDSAPPPPNSPPPVNWEALDALVLDFVRSDRLVLPSPPPSPSPPSSPSSSSTTTATSASSSDSSTSSSASYRSRQLIRHSRRALEAGDVDAALALLRAHAPAALRDHRLLFHLHKQRFVELVRRGTEADREAALDCLRTALAPYALDAYPEAYEEFKHIMLVLIYDKDDQSSPVVNEVFCSRQGISSPISDLTERLLFEDRDPPVVPQECSLEAPPFDENELCRMNLDLSLLDQLVHEYCIYRGIVEGSSHVHAGTAEQKCNPNNEISSVNKQATNNETPLECEMINNDNGDCATSNITHDDSWSRRLRRVRSNSSEQRRRKRWRGRVDDLDYACETLLDVNKDNAIDMDEDTIAEKQEFEANSSDTRSTEDQKYEVILEMRDLTQKGMASKVVEEINSIDPEFFSQNSFLLFQLKQVEFLKLVAAGDHVSALKVASTHLGPLAANNHDLLKPLKETLVTLIQSNEDVLTNAVSLPVLASSLQVAMSRRLGIEEPRLMKIVRTTVHTHTEWFKLHMCKDRFEKFFKINCLKEVDPSVASHNMPKAQTDDCGNGSSQITTCSSVKAPDESSSPQVSSEVGCDENAILKVMVSDMWNVVFFPSPVVTMCFVSWNLTLLYIDDSNMFFFWQEFIALPRADAIQLLMQYDGDAEAVIQQIFQ
ncbi:hypothetical protein PR202_ga00092 [Eleusine coracana subsp. coracana]|uniref:CTLH domain-containing protein n=1 Tax=Eleusine coracana subsp. coracana TaxID=191504 RepID=A0AAV5BF70_ELECO|nr:hypothetical protein PR202_ga00092 [Eleusine coracana subsp. coracana]